jgi:hypothetical protein
MKEILRPESHVRMVVLQHEVNAKIGRGDVASKDRVGISPRWQRLSHESDQRNAKRSSFSLQLERPYLDPSGHREGGALKAENAGASKIDEVIGAIKYEPTG